MAADFTCRRCEPPLPHRTAMQLENHLVHSHQIARDVARAAMTVAAPLAAPILAVAPSLKETKPMKRTRRKPNTCSECGKAGHKAPTCPETAKNGHRAARAPKAKGGGGTLSARARTNGTSATAHVRAMFADLERQLADVRRTFEREASRVDNLAGVIQQLGRRVKA